MVKIVSTTDVSNDDEMKSIYYEVPWKHQSGTKLKPLDDGHLPETFRHDESSCSQIVVQDDEYRRDFLSIFPDVLSSHLTDEIYRMTINNTEGRSWGTYVTVEEAQEYFKQMKDGETFEESLRFLKTSLREEQYRHLLAKAAVHHFLLEKANLAIDSLSNDLSQNKIHGVAVWALSSHINDEVQYHIDYAELVRYEHNIIYPPLYAGTVQCSPLNVNDRIDQTEQNGGSMVGGDFAVNIQGLEHYEKHGYKGKKSQDPFAGFKPESSHQYSTSFQTSSSSKPFDMYNHFYTNQMVSANNKTTDDFWIAIPYRYNQGILHKGEYPHLSTLIKKMSPPNIHQRVIMGLNVFGFDVGPLVQKAPEHSATFQKKVKRMQALSRSSQISQQIYCQDGQNDSTAYGMNLHQLRKNKTLTKLLVLAKREKVKQAYENEKRQTLVQLKEIISKEKQVTVADLMKRLSRFNHNDTPREVDVLVYIHNWIQAKELETHGISIQCTNEEKTGMFDDHGMILPSCILAMN